MPMFAVLCVEELRIALPLHCIERVLRAVEPTPLPRAPVIVLGMVNVHGTIVPVVDLRARFRMPAHEIDPSDRFVLARTARGVLAIVADAVDDILDCAEADRVDADSIAPGLEHVEGVLRRPDGLLLIHDIERFLSLDESCALDNALAAFAET